MINNDWFKTTSDSHNHSINLLKNYTEKEVTWDIYSPSGEQRINTKCDVIQTLFRYHKIRRCIIAFNCCLCGSERQKQQLRNLFFWQQHNSLYYLMQNLCCLRRFTTTYSGIIPTGFNLPNKCVFDFIVLPEHGQYCTYRYFCTSFSWQQYRTIFFLYFLVCLFVCLMTLHKTCAIKYFRQAGRGIRLEDNEVSSKFFGKFHGISEPC